MRLKKILQIALCVLLCATFVIGMVACKKDDDAKDPSSDSTQQEAPTYKITVWVSDVAGVVEKTKEQIDAFNATNTAFKIDATVNAVGEGEAATQVLTDVESAPDIYCFAQDQLARLVQAGALAAPNANAVAEIVANNDAGSVKAATAAGKVQCYPLTSDNGYYMYYDTSVIAADHLDSLEDILADCAAAGKGFSFQLEDSAWYNASFFFATGCVSEWTMDTDGNYTSVNDTFNSPEGVIALKGMQKVLQYEKYSNSANVDDFCAAIPSAVVISGPWAAADAKKNLGENFGATDLPSFTVDGKSYHLGSYSGNKLLGVKPCNDAAKTVALQRLALYLTGAECQKQRFESFNWGPSNKECQALDAVKNDPALNALALQNEYAVPQGNIHGSWWDIGKAYATAAKLATTDADLEKALKEYDDAIHEVLTMDPALKNAFTVIGNINGEGWDVDHKMVESPAGTWTSEEVFTFNGGEEFKCRKGLAWDVNYGDNGGNFVVAEAGQYKVQLVVTDNGGTITLIPA